jgi:hypothetical protein
MSCETLDKDKITMESLIKNWHHFPLDPIPLDKEIIAIWKNEVGNWKSGKFQGYLFYRRGSFAPFNDIPVHWIYYNIEDEKVKD